MWAIVLKIFPLALGEMLSPVVFAIALVLLAGQNRPIAKTFSFLFGDALAVAIIGVFGYLVGAGVLHVSSNTSLSRIIDIVIAVILVALGIKTLLSKPHKDVAKNQSQVSDEHPKSKKGIIELFLFGFILNITNLDSLIFYIAACREIGQGHILDVEKIILVVVCGLFYVMPVLLPLVLYLIIPKLAQKVLNPIYNVTLKYGNYITAAVCFVFAVYLVLK